MQHSQTLPNEQRLAIQIGVNLGDVIAEGRRHFSTNWFDGHRGIGSSSDCRRAARSPVPLDRHCQRIPLRVRGEQPGTSLRELV